MIGELMLTRFIKNLFAGIQVLGLKYPDTNVSNANPHLEMASWQFIDNLLTR